MNGIQEWKIEAKNVKSLCWQGDALVDWVSGGHVYQLDGTVIPRHVGYSYRFDAAVVSTSGEYTVIYEKLGTKGLVLKQGKILREINRSFYYAHAYEYPVALLKLSDGREALAHCPDHYRQLEIDDLTTGERLTKSSERKPMDYFYSRLAINPSSTLLLSAGWYWAPWSSATLHEFAKALKDPRLLDDRGLIPDIRAEISSVAFLDDDKLILSSSEEEYVDVDENIEDIDETTELRPKSLGVFDITQQRFISSIQPEETVGTILPLNSQMVVGFYENPKLISLETGKTLHHWPELKTGKQTFSIIWHIDPVPPLALDAVNHRFAVADETSITVVQIDPTAFIQNNSPDKE